MKRYLTIARQVAKERIGTKDESVNSDEVESERDVCNSYLHITLTTHSTLHSPPTHTHTSTYTTPLAYCRPS
jgi:hypothetical protein